MGRRGGGRDGGGGGGGGGESTLPFSFSPSASVGSTLKTLTTKEQTTIFFCKFSKNVKSKLYYIGNSKTRGETV